ncbi:MAG: IS256 family transposase [Nitrospiria bacterium]
MKTKLTDESYRFPTESTQDVLSRILREGARKMLEQAVEEEVNVYLKEREHLKDAENHQQVVRNGYLPQRPFLTGLGPIQVQQPRVRDRRSPCDRERFTSEILPRYLRKAPNMEALIPWLYLYGISTEAFPRALEALIGPGVSGLSATTITRLKSQWEQEQKQWANRSLEGRQYVYVWADGVYFNIRLEEEGNDRQCILVLMGATQSGEKELIAISDGYRESEQSWKELLLGCKDRGLRVDPKLAIGDGALGFWAAVEKVWPETKGQRCWVHKTANVLNKMPKHIQPKAKGMLHDLWRAETKKEANKAFDLFLAAFGVKHPKATECLEKDRERLLTFYGFPAEHWKHLRTTNPIESVFASVRLRTNKTKGSGSRAACLAMVFKLFEVAEKNFNKLSGVSLLPNVVAGRIYVDGIEEKIAA